jgi:hypothetical protein
MFSGKRAAVYIHGDFHPIHEPWFNDWLKLVTVEMSRKEFKSNISKRGGMIWKHEPEEEANKAIGDSLEREWKRAQIVHWGRRFGNGWMLCIVQSESREYPS